MPPILLTTINARYYHTSFGLRWLRANMGALREECAIREFQVGQGVAEIAEALLAENPRLIGVGIYIWNVAPATEVIRLIRSVRPDILIVIGGPEASHAGENSELWELADYVVRGEGEEAFAALSAALLRGEHPVGRVIDLGPADLAALAPPYELYTDEDIARRKVYVEAARGCPFRCEFCLSSLDVTVRDFPLEPFLEAMERLIERGALEFIFVDRTFNLDAARAEAILSFFLGRWREGMHLHFEIVPDRLSEKLLALIARFPAGGLHLEVGLQTFNPVVQAAISRRQNIEKTVQNLQFLRQQTGAWIHADLIVGLPGESLESFAAGFDRSLALRPQQIQVGVLKRLKGTPIARHDAAFEMVYSAQPPYEIMQNDRIDFLTMQRLKRFARYFELYHNTGNFTAALELLWRARPSAFAAFMALTDALWARTGRTHELALTTLARELYVFLVAEGAVAPGVVAETIAGDFHRLPGRRDKLDFGA